MAAGRMARTAGQQKTAEWLVRSAIGIAAAPLTVYLLHRLRHRWATDARLASADDKEKSRKEGSIQKKIQTLVVVALLYGGNRMLAKWLQGKFPAPLVGMFALFGALTGLNAVSPPVARSIISFLKPGTDLLVKWLPIFFVTPLVVLPLAVNKIPSLAEAGKFGAVIVGGFFWTLLTTASLTGAIVNATSSSSSRGQSAASGTQSAPAQPAAPPPTFPSLLAAGTVASAAAVLLPWSEAPVALALTVFYFLAGRKVPARFQTVLHPLLSCAVLSSATMAALGSLVKGVRSVEFLRTYKKGTLSRPGAGDIFLEILPCGLIALAISLYNQRALLAQKFLPIVGGTLGSSVLSLAWSSIVARLLKLSPDMAVVPLPRVLMSALAVPISATVGADMSLTLTGVVISGLLGANFGASVLNKFGVTNPVVRGVAVGSVSHGLGTAALVAKEPASASVSAVALALVGVFVSAALSHSGCRNFLIGIARGGAKPKIKA
eukprot:jgi/Mesvir1/6002/Mv00750-RA.1